MPVTNEYDPQNVFAKILRDELPSTRIYEDDEFVAFHDIEPIAPVHVLLIPRFAMLRGPAEVSGADVDWIGRMMVIATRLAAGLGLEESGYRLVLNNGSDAGQAVPHLHVHIIGGAPLGPMA
ncbi:MAG: histidine triad nucleotide-binding protein [Chloroflexi bacterium]|nr:MAG: histidine triad nucleotide-binding protein [Chloroflexota bacterium]